MGVGDVGTSNVLKETFLRKLMFLILIPVNIQLKIKSLRLASKH